jgi:Fe-S-cluster containining protein
LGTKVKKTKIRREDLAPGACLCDHCSGKCCRYFSLPIETPANWDDYDTIRWYLAHGQTLVYVEKATWYLVVMTRCKYLSRDDRCQIYLSRPRICREYTTDECEYDDDWIFEKVFETPEQLWEYAEAVLPPRRRRNGAAGSLPVITINGRAVVTASGVRGQEIGDGGEESNGIP